MDKVIKTTVILLAVLLITTGMVIAEEQEEFKIDQLMKEIMDSSEEIISSEANVTPATQLLAALPEPAEKAKIAVYEIADKTGQRKDNINSSVVTQGATDMMVTALHRSRQFVILDRVNFNNFINEQNLQAQDRIAPGEGPDIGNMSGPDYIISGAITEYQVDKDTGGIGLKIAGKGGSKKIARASCAVDLRLTNATTGEVVWGRSLKKEITGERVGLQVFSFMGDNVVEFESGKGMQEVINLVVRTLLEEAVFKMYESNLF
ncbi:MAG: CsgG/HfaB family protein [Halanaerobiaceae bacterium]